MTIQNDLNRLIQLSGALIAFWVFYYLNTILANEQHKAMLMLALAQRGGVDSFFQIPVLFYRFISAIGIPIAAFGLASGIGFTLYFFSKSTGYFVYALKVFLLVPAFMLYLGVPSKEFFTLLFLAFSVSAWVKQRYILATLCGLVYAFAFRLYFLPFIALKAFGHFFPSLFIYIGLALVPVVICFIPYTSDIMVGLMERRDLVFLEYRGIIRSAFENPLTISGNDSVFLNYLYALARLNLPIIFNFGPREIFLQLYIVTILLIVLGRHTPHEIKAAILLHMMVLAIFEPDLGSYIRHLSSLFPLYFAILEGRIRTQTSGVSVQFSHSVQRRPKASVSV